MVKKIVGDDKILAYALKNALEHDGKSIAGSVLSPLFVEGLEKENVKEIMPRINEIVKRVNSMKIEEQKKEFDKLEKLLSHRDVKEEGELPELPNAKEGKVVMRLAPYPSGALHIGNTKTYLLNALYCEKYNGRLIFVIDDTIGSEEKQIAPEAYKLIPEAFDWLGVKYDKPILYKSDRLEIYYKYAEEMIKKDKAYVCSCNSEKLRDNRAKGKECEHRKQTVAENMELWKKMFNAKEGSYALRIKTSMSSPDPAFRDRVIFRICDREHPRVGKKYRVWPLLDFSWGIDDHLLGITHIIRGKELMIETEMEKYIMEIFGWEYPEFIHAALVRLEGVGAKVSKSKAQKEVREGKFFGWHDPRTWSVQSLIKRGIKPEAIKQFVANMSLNQKEVVVPVDMLYLQNRELIKDSSRPASFEENKKGKIEILMPDATIVRGNSDIDIKKIKDETMIFFKGLGYVRFNESEKIKFWFCHK